MIRDGLQIMVIGMGVVFLILAMLVGATALTTWIIKAGGWDRPAAPGEQRSPGAGAVAAAISAAVARFRGERKGQ
ncbi:MAG: OadG family protein [Proteobacteria bacterium]|nr:OadG family protein [Pseudomonadota bacterium]